MGTRRACVAAEHAKRPVRPRHRGIVVAVTVVVVVSVVAACLVLGVFGKTDVKEPAAVSSTAAPKKTARRPHASDASPAPKTLTVDPAEQAKKDEQTRLDGLKGTLEQQMAGYGGTWSAYVEDLNTGAAISVNDHQQPSASLIKLYVMLAVYTQIAQGKLAETPAIDQLLQQMITVSSNQAANSLVSTLGGGDAQTGFAVVNQIAQDNGFGHSRMNDLLYDSGTHDSSLKQTSVDDCGRFLAEAYRGQLVSKTVSDNMVNLLLGQQRRNKIPSGLPAGTKVGNKTGEIPGTENDAAIIWTNKGAYVLTVMSENVSNASAQTDIQQLSSMVWSTMNQ